MFAGVFGGDLAVGFEKGAEEGTHGEEVGDVAEGGF